MNEAKVLRSSTNALGCEFWARVDPEIEGFSAVSMLREARVAREMDAMADELDAADPAGRA